MSSAIQNLGLFHAEDRYEGYAAERTDLLKFIKANGINNVVFIAAGLHGHVAPYAPVWPTPYGVSTGYGYSVRDRHPARAHRPPHHRAVRRHHKRHARRDHYVDHDRDRRHRDGRHERSDRSDRRRTRGR